MLTEVMMTERQHVLQLPLLPARKLDGNKGDYGRVLIVAGSRGRSGAAILSGLGALRGGAGLVRNAVPEEILPIVAGANPCYLTAPLPQDSQGTIGTGAEKLIVTWSQANHVVAFGPGWG